MKYLLIATLFLASCSESESPTDTVESKVGGHHAPIEVNDVNSAELLDSVSYEIQKSTDGFSYTIIESNQGWGYQINKDGAMLINQKHIPSIPGVKGFETKEKATIAAEYILKQVEKGNFPPTVNREILDSLKVL
jgi:hypothetical protein